MQLNRYPKISEELQIKPINKIPTPLLEKYFAELSLGSLAIPTLQKESIKFGAFVNGKIIGFVCGQPHANRKKNKLNLYASAIYITPEFRRIGIAKLFTYKLISEGKKIGCHEITFGALYPKTKKLFETEKAKIKAKQNKQLEIEMRHYEKRSAAIVKIKPKHH